MNSGDDLLPKQIEHKWPDEAEPIMIRIPAGTYQVGLSQKWCERLTATSEQAQHWYEEGYFQREQPQHPVALAGFYLGKYPVTVGEYRSFIEAGGYEASHFWSTAAWSWLSENGRCQPSSWDDPGRISDDRLPVTGVSWYEAQAYCRWLSAVCRTSFRLPTEFEWEAAARGPKGLLYPWGNDFDGSFCNYSASGFGRPTPVGAFSTAGDGPWGMVDMAGNVSEWTSSTFQPYLANLQAMIDPDEPQERVTRGGSWHSPALRLRCTARGYNDPDFSDNDLGFRLASDG